MKEHSIASIRAGLLAKDFSAVELAREALAYAERENPATSAYLRFSPERALAAAERVDDRIAAGHEPGVLAGVPVDADGFVTHAAFTASIPGKFKAADKNSDGFLDKDELLHGFLGIPVKPAA